jgi:hypothetical protein
VAECHLKDEDQRAWSRLFDRWSLLSLHAHQLWAQFESPIEKGLRTLGALASAALTRK